MSSFFGGGEDDTTGDTGLGGMADEIASTFDGHDSWVDDGGEEPAVQDRASVVGYGDRRYVVRCSECGTVSGQHDSANAAQQAGREHSMEHAPTWTVVEM